MKKNIILQIDISILHSYPFICLYTDCPVLLYSLLAAIQSDYLCTHKTRVLSENNVSEKLMAEQRVTQPKFSFIFCWRYSQTAFAIQISSNHAYNEIV
jgi:hypothetical protein